MTETAESAQAHADELRRIQATHLAEVTALRDELCSIRAVHATAVKDAVREAEEKARFELFLLREAHAKEVAQLRYELRLEREAPDKNTVEARDKVIGELQRTIAAHYINHEVLAQLREKLAKSKRRCDAMEYRYWKARIDADLLAASADNHTETAASSDEDDE